MNPVDHEAIDRAVLGGRVSEQVGAQLHRLQDLPDDFHGISPKLAIAYVMATEGFSLAMAIDYLMIARGRTDVIEIDAEGKEHFV